MFKGTFVAVVTPFKNDLSIDYKKLDELVDFHIKNKTTGIVPCGTTGENPSFTLEEHISVMERVIKASNGKLKVIAGTGSNNTDKTVFLTKEAKKLGADAALVITPYYNKPTQAGLFNHFKIVAEKTNFPIIIYNVPSRTGVNISPETVSKLAEIDEIVGIKDASGSLYTTMELVKIKEKKPDFSILSGEDALTFPMITLGASGVISVTANIVPQYVSEMVSNSLEGNILKARKLHYKLLPLTKALFIETNPCPVKEAMGMLGMIEPVLRPPLVRVSEESRKLIKKELLRLNLI